MRDGHDPKAIWLFQIDNPEGKSLCFPTASSKPAQSSNRWLFPNFQQRRFHNR
jgi:hypothetical protein